MQDAQNKTPERGISTKEQLFSGIRKATLASLGALMFTVSGYAGNPKSTIDTNTGVNPNNPTTEPKNTNETNKNATTKTLDAAEMLKMTDPIKFAMSKVETYYPGAKVLLGTLTFKDQKQYDDINKMLAKAFVGKIIDEKEFVGIVAATVEVSVFNGFEFNSKYEANFSEDAFAAQTGFMNAYAVRAPEFEKRYAEQKAIIAQKEQNIAQNKQEIAQNKQEIAQKDQNIAQNKQEIAQSKVNIDAMLETTTIDQVKTSADIRSAVLYNEMLYIKNNREINDHKKQLFTTAKMIEGKNPYLAVN